MPVSMSSQTFQDMEVLISLFFDFQAGKDDLQCQYQGTSGINIKWCSVQQKQGHTAPPSLTSILKLAVVGPREDHKTFIAIYQNMTKCLLFASSIQISIRSTGACVCPFWSYYSICTSQSIVGILFEICLYIQV